MQIGETVFGEATGDSTTDGVSMSETIDGDLSRGWTRNIGTSRRSLPGRLMMLESMEDERRCSTWNKCLKDFFQFLLITTLFNVS